METMPDHSSDAEQQKSPEKKEGEPVDFKDIRQALHEAEGSNAQIQEFLKQFDAASPEEQDRMRKDPALLAQLGVILRAQEASVAKASGLYEKYLAQQGISKEKAQIDALQRSDPEKYAKMQAAFTAMPDINESMQFKVGDVVQFPMSKENSQLVYWEVARAENGHCLLVRPGAEVGKYEFAIFSEKEILKYNQGKR